jgi:two-component system sensor histidine kinase KdpD
MTDGARPDPDALLRLAEREQSGKGKLKIFFGMAAGVGKTYGMLKEGRQKRAEGLDVVVGYLETHQRKETEELAVGLEAVPRRRVEYRGKLLEEMDVDAVISRRPDLVLVDELAHTNVPGTRNRKRYQDVLEIMEQGIDVSTTMNVQHLESFADTIEEITGISVAERVPDSVFDATDQVVLIDISPEELLSRLSEGKVYTADMAQSAMENFFKKSTLTALREMSLRYTALMVNHQLSSFGAETRAEGPLGSEDRLLVAISPSPNSAHLIRWTRRRAFSLKAEWTALYIETGRPLRDADQESLRKNLNLARQLGARVVSMPSESVAEAIVGYARSNNVSQIVMGKPGLATRRRLLRGPSITDRVIEASGDIDVAVVQEKGMDLRHARVRLPDFLRSERASLLKVLAVLALVTGIGFVALPLIGYRSVGILYLMAVIGLAFFVSRIAVLLAAALGAVFWDLVFIPPPFTFYIRNLEDILMLFLYFITAAALAFLMTRIRLSQKLLSVRQRRLSLLFNLSQSLSFKQSLVEIARTGLEHISRYFEAEVLLFFAADQDTLDPNPFSLGGIVVDEKEQSVARWCFANRVPCGRYTDTLHMSRFHYIPLLTPDSTAGVLGIRLPEEKKWMPDHEESLQTLGRTLALSLGRELLAEENRKNLMARESERLSKILLNTISHELRTPLTTIKGSITALMDSSTGADPNAREILLTETLTATDRLNGIVENLLNMSRLESGMMKLKRSDTDVFDLASVVADALRRQTTDHPFTVKVDEDVPPISVDFILMVQVLTNIVQNAVHYTPPGTPIELAVERNRRDVLITVSDSGPGVASDELPHLFDMFFRGKRATSGGVGLGLSICKGIVETHGGIISAYINRRGGLSIAIVLPNSVREPAAGAGKEAAS